MPESGRCVYCGSLAIKDAFICQNCYEKLKLVRRLRKIVFRIKRQAEEEKRDS